MTQHANLTTERWRSFSRTQQLLHIASEMHRAMTFIESNHVPIVREGYERVLRLVDLTAQVQSGTSFRRELLRWRGVVGGLYLASTLDLDLHRLALRTLLELDPVTEGQIAFMDV